MSMSQISIINIVLFLQLITVVHKMKKEPDLEMEMKMKRLKMTLNTCILLGLSDVTFTQLDNE